MKIIEITLFLFMVTSLMGQSTEKPTYSVGEKHLLHSNILAEEREIFIYVPNGFWGMDEKNEHYPITIVLDGESQFQQTVSAIDFLSAAPLGNDVMPRTIVVGIPNVNRSRDLTPTKGIIGIDSSSLEITGGGKKFLGFITEELIPYLAENFSKNQHRTIIGHSLGGLIVFEALLNNRTYFTNYLAIDPALNYDNESYFDIVLDSLRQVDLSQENLFIARAKTLPAFLEMASLEEDNAEVIQITKSNKKFSKLANNEHWKLNFLLKDYPDENHFSIPYPATYHSMKFFYEFYPFKEMINYYHPSYKDRTDLVEKLKSHYQFISEKMGYKIIPMESYLNSWAHGISHFERDDLAIDLFDYSIEIYPENASAYHAKGYFMLNLDKQEEAIQLFEKSLLLKEDPAIIDLLRDLKERH